MKALHSLIALSILAPAQVFAQFGRDETPVSGPGGQFDYDGSSDQLRNDSAIGNSSSGCKSGELCNPLKVDSIEGLFGNILSDIILPLSAIIGTVFIIWAGFGFVMAQGDSTKLQLARKRLLFVLIGVAIVIGAQVILSLLLNTLTELANV